MRAGITEVDQEAVADIPGYKASKRVDDRGNGLVVVGDQVAQIFWIEPRRQRGGTHEITEHHRELPTLRPVLRQRRLDLSRKGRNWRAWHLEPRDRPQHPFAMPEQDPELFEVGFSEFGQCLKVTALARKTASYSGSASSLSQSPISMASSRRATVIRTLPPAIARRSILQASSTGTWR